METWTSHGNRRCVCVVLRFFRGFIMVLFPIPCVIPASGRVPPAPQADTSLTGTEKAKRSVGSKSVTTLTKTCN